MVDIKIFADIGIGNQIQFIPAMKILEKEGYRLFTESKILWDLVPEILTEKLKKNEKAKYNFGIILYSQGLPTVIKAKKVCKKVIGFPPSFKITNHKPIPIISSVFYTNKCRFNKNITEIENNIDLISYFNIKQETIDYSLNISSATEKDVIGISAGSGGHPQKRWGNWIELIDLINDKEIRLFGTENQLNENIKKRTKHKNVKIIQTATIKEAALEISKCEIFISNDNGLMHLADILKVPVIAIFGMTEIKKNRPWNKPNKIVRRNLQCSPCYRSGKIKCINSEKYLCTKIPAIDVYKKYKELEKSL